MAEALKILAAKNKQKMHLIYEIKMEKNLKTLNA